MKTQFKEYEKMVIDKAKYLKANYPFEDIPKLRDKVTCIHCNRSFMVADFKVIKQGREEYIVCKHWPECDGTVIDWFITES